MGVIVDTSVLVEAERRRVRLSGLLEELRHEPIGMAAITASELLHGCHRASGAARARRAAFVDALLDAIPVLAFGLAEARRHAELWAGLGREGATIGPHDLLIGATALARGWALATMNRREFVRVPGLQLLAMERFRS
jgi:predicted nucleic acid-binding protein